MNFEFWDNCWGRPTQPFHLTQPHHFLRQNFSRFFAGQDRVLLPLCGKTQDLNFLAEQGINAVGVEFNPVAVESFFKDSQLTPEITTFADKACYRAPNIDLWLSDFFKLSQEELGVFHCIFDRAALVALPEELRKPYAEHLLSFLAPQGRLLLVTMDYDTEQMSGPPFYIDQAQLEQLFPKATITQLARTNILQSHSRWQELELSRLDEVLYEIQIN